jgi:hypothetical protein
VSLAGAGLGMSALDAMGLGATALFILPAVLTGFVLLRHQQRTGPARQAAATAGTDRWGPFLPVPAVALSLLLPEPGPGFGTSFPAEGADRQGDRRRGPDGQRDRVPDREHDAVLQHAPQAGGQRAGGQ